MRTLLLGSVLAACGSSAPTPTTSTGSAAPPPPSAWRVPAGWKTEVIPFPLGFAPTVVHTGVEELRFPPGMFEPEQPDYWSYVFAWRLTDAASLDAPALGAELTAYFAGLVAAVDTEGVVTARDTIRVEASAAGDSTWELTAQTFDAFKTGGAITLVGHARRETCGTGSLWVFVLARPDSGIRAELDALAAEATCGQEAR